MRGSRALLQGEVRSASENVSRSSWYRALRHLIIAHPKGRKHDDAIDLCFCVVRLDEPATTFGGKAPQQRP
jgi:hypothetical protein